MTALAGKPLSGHKARIWAFFIIDRTGFSIAVLGVSDPIQFGGVRMRRQQEEQDWSSSNSLAVLISFNIAEENVCGYVSILMC